MSTLKHTTSPPPEDSSEDEKKCDPVKEGLKYFEKNCNAFHDTRNIVYISISDKPGSQTFPLKAEAFEHYLRQRFYTDHDRLLSEKDFQIIESILVARAMANTKTEEICCRVGESGGNVYLDLANKDRQVIEVTKDGFRIVKNAPLHFLRPSGMEALPIPTKTKYSLQKLLRSLFRSLQERDLLIIAAFLLGCLRPRGPFPILQFIGAQGSAKSTNSRMIKRCIDPSFADSRSLPKDERDFAIAAQNNWLLCFDNVSSIPKWMSDSFCRLSTGGAVSIRKLYSNSEECLFSAKRPAILGGIVDPIERGDLKDRTLVIFLSAISPEQRQTEEKLWADFDGYHSAILGALLNCVSTGLRNLEKVETKELPRMADWYRFLKAAEPAMGFRDGLLAEVLKEGRALAAEAVLESSPVADILLDFMSTTESLEGSATELWIILRNHVREQLYFDQRRWPASPRQLSNELRRLEPDLQQHGVRITFSRSGERRIISITQMEVKECEK